MIQRPFESQNEILYMAHPALSAIPTPPSATPPPVQNLQTLQRFPSPLYSASNRPAWTFSRTQWYFESICLVLLWNRGSLAILTAPVLSEFSMVGFCWMSPSSLYRFLNHDASFPDSHRAIYSASVVLMAVTDCLFDLQVIAPPAAMKTYPVVDFPSSRFLYAALAYPSKLSGLSGTCLYVIPRSLVPAK